MATTPSSFARIRPASLPALAGNGLRATLGMPARPKSSQPGFRADALFALAKEPEDARLTGGTRSLDRRLLALNLSGVTRKLRVSAERIRTALHSTAA